MSDLRILGICGSLRAGSYNRSLLREAAELAPPGMIIETYEGLGDIPLYNQDVQDKGDPEPVLRLKSAIREANGILFCSPEYNYSVPGVLKNAIDWASREPRVLPGKPVAILGASPGMLGTGRMQYHLRQVFVFTQCLCMVTPEVMVAKAAEKFDSNGRLTDEKTLEFLRAYLDSFDKWVRWVNSRPE